MKLKFIFIAIFFLFLIFSINTFAQSNEKFFDSYYKNGQLNIYATLGWWWGLTLSGQAEIIMGEWNISDVMPIDWGISGRVIFESWSWIGYSETYLGASPMFTVHIGIADIDIDYYASLGIGFAIYNSSDNNYYYYWHKPFEIGFSAASGVIWYLSNNFGLTLDYTYIGWVSVWGVGIVLKL